MRVWGTCIQATTWPGHMPSIQARILYGLYCLGLSLKSPDMTSEALSVTNNFYICRIQINLFQLYLF